MLGRRWEQNVYNMRPKWFKRESEQQLEKTSEPAKERKPRTRLVTATLADHFDAKFLAAFDGLERDGHAETTEFTKERRRHWEHLYRKDRSPDEPLPEVYVAKLESLYYLGYLAVQPEAPPRIVVHYPQVWGEVLPKLLKAAGLEFGPAGLVQPENIGQEIIQFESAQPPEVTTSPTEHPGQILAS